MNTAPSYIKVLHFLTAEYEMLKLFNLNVEKINLRHLRDFALWNENFIWYTYNYMFFKLDKNDMVKLFPMWCEVQQMQQKILGQTFFKRMLFKVISFTQSLLFCRILVLMKPKMTSCIRHVLIKLKLFMVLKYMLSLFKKDA
jgi:hypothetical protein